MKNLWLVIVFVSGCATSSRTYLADGQEGYSIQCSGSMLNWGLCYEKAGQLCGRSGYEIIDKSGDQGAIFGGSSNGFWGSSIHNRSILIKCRN